MSESNTGDEFATAVYQVQIWATPEFTPRVTADSVEEAEEEAAELVKMEHGVADDQIKTVRHNHDLGDGRHFVEVWATKEYVEQVEASSEEEAEEKAREQVMAFNDVVDNDINSINVEAPL